MDLHVPYGMFLLFLFVLFHTHGCLWSHQSESFAAHLDIQELPAHHFIKSIYNITIESGWLWLHIQWGDNVKIFWEASKGIYNPSDPNQ